MVLFIPNVCALQLQYTTTVKRDWEAEVKQLLTLMSSQTFRYKNVVMTCQPFQTDCLVRRLGADVIHPLMKVSLACWQSRPAKPLP